MILCKIKFPWKLFIALIILTFVPTIYQTFRVFFLVTSSSVEALDIVGQIEWFDLINETIVAFLIIPMYYTLNKFVGDKKIFSSRITQAGLITFVIYLIFAIITYVSSLSIVDFMAVSAESIVSVTQYLQFETIAFTIGIIGTFFGVVYVIIGKSKYIYTLLAVKVGLMILGDSILIPTFGVNGIAYTNIILSIIIAVVSIALLHFEGLLYLKFDKITDYSWIVDWAKIGLFSGAQVFLDNIIYTLMICKMVNVVSEQGNYWVANNFIWGWLLVPTIALAEIIKRESANGCKKENMVMYLIINAAIVLVWIASIPSWNFVFNTLMGISDASVIFNIIIMLVPFYVFYNLSSLFDNIFYGMGKTLPVFITSIVVNIGYYGILFALFISGKITFNMTAIILMFGFGMIVHFICILILYLIMIRENRSNNIKKEGVIPSNT